MPTTTVAAPAHPAPATRPPPPARLARPPVAFEPNRGQTAPEVAYLARCRRYTAFLTADGATLRLAPRGRAAPRTLRLRVHGAAADGAWIAGPPLRGVVHYLRGADPARWRRDVPTYARVERRDVLPGVAVAYHGTPDGELELDFLVAPGADPSALRLVVEGADRLELAPSGELAAHVGGEALRLRPPVLYQESGPARTPVAGRFALDGDGAVRFDVGPYDATRPLVIDPVLVYSTYLGGSDDELGNTAVAVDAEGHAYVAGQTGSVDFPVANALDPVLGAFLTDGFVAKLSPSGADLVYATYLGGDSVDECGAIAVDASGSAYVAGSTGSEDFPVTVGAAQPAHGGGQRDAFVAKLDPAGSALLYATFLGGSEIDLAHDLALDATGAAYVTGATRSPDFPTAGALQPALAGTRWDAFVTKVAPDGGAFLFSTFLGGEEDDEGQGIAVDAEGAVYVAGYTESADFPAVNALQPALGGPRDAFVARLDVEGDPSAHAYAYRYCTFLGGSGGDGGINQTRVAADRGEAIVLTTTTSDDFPTRNALQPARGGARDVALARLTADGADLVFSTYLGGPGSDASGDVAVDGEGNIVVVGFAGVGFPTELPLQETGDGAAFVAVLTGDGSLLLFSTFLGGSGTDYATGVAVDHRNRVYVAGWTRSDDFPTTAGALQPAYGGGGYDAFVAKLAARRVYPYEYAALLVSGVQDDPASRRLARGAYATSVHVHNPNPERVLLFKKLALAYPPAEQRAGAILPIATDALGPDEALKTDGDELAARLFPDGLPAPVLQGFVVIQSERPLDVTALYTTTALDASGEPAGHSSLHVERIGERVRQADLAIEKAAEVSAAVEIEDDVFDVAVLYTIEVHNAGPGTAEEVTIADVLTSEQALFVIIEAIPPTVEPPGLFTMGEQTLTASDFTVTIAELPAGEVARVQFWVLARYSIGLGAVSLTNAASVAHALVDPSPQDDAVEITTQLWP